MIYTDEVRKKLDAILKAFGEYIDGQSYFDIVYSKKIGYVWILLLPNKNIGNLVEQKESGDPIRRML